MILRQYSMGSGYGSLSRTVEEIILAFDSTYNTIKESLRFLINLAKDSQKEHSYDKATLWTSVLVVLSNIDNAVSRLNKETQVR